MNQEESKFVKTYIAFANDAVGILALTLAATALNFSHPQPFAILFLVVVVLWLSTRQGENKNLIQEYYEKHKGIKKLLMLWELKIYLIGVCSLAFIAISGISLNEIYTFLGYPIPNK